MRSKIYSIIAIVVLFFLSKGCISDYVKGGDKEAIGNYEKMLSESQKAEAILDNQYREVTMKIMGAKIKSYEFTYEYMVKGNKYKGTHTFTKVPTTSSIQVYYLSSDPSISSVDPADKLAIEKRKDSTNEPLYWGIGWGVLCLLTILGFIKELRGKKKLAYE